MIKLLFGNCLELLPQLKDNSVDMVMCDLPYEKTSCDWDSLIPLEPLWNEYNRICKPNAAMVFTAVQPFTSLLVSSNIQNFRYEWIWEKPQGTNPLNKDNMPLRSHENILVFYRKPPIYNPQMEKGSPYKGFQSQKSTIGEVYGKAKSIHRNNAEGTRYPKTVLRFKQEKGLHPTQKPVPLMEYLIKTYTNEGAVVLDNTMGSGTTGVACIRTKREFIGMDNTQEHFDTANKRLQEEYKLSQMNVMDLMV